MFDIPCIILAGGRSSRMGEDKALLPFSTHKTLTEFQLFRLSKIFKEVYISCKSRDKFDFEANFIEDIPNSSVFAPTVAFLSIYKFLQVENFFVISVDSPFVSILEIEKIMEKDISSLDASVAKTENGLEPLCGIYHRSLEELFQKRFKQNKHKLINILENSNVKYIYFENSNSFANLNHPHEYEEALLLI